MAASNNDWRVPRGDANELDRLVEIHKLRVKWSKLQRQLYADYSYPVLMEHERELVEKEIATIKVKLILLRAKL